MNSRVDATARLQDLSAAARALWAKSGDDHAREGGGEPWLALPQHMLDSAGVVGHLWDSWAPPSVKQHILRGTKVSPEQARVLLCWLGCVHDVGKATLSFALQLDARAGFEAFSRNIRDAGLPLGMSTAESNIPRFHHSLASRVIVHNWLRTQGVDARVASRLAGILDAHHGAPSDQSLRKAARAIINGYSPEWRAVHDELMTFAADVTSVRDVLPHLRTPITASHQSLLTGLVIMADWIASNTDYFPLTENGLAGERSEAGFADADLTRPWSASPPADWSGETLDAHLRDRFDWPESFEARPVQRAVSAACAALDGPGLVIIEAPTGEGKTEAALTAAEILADRSDEGGIMVAAPTMSTADGLFRRVLDWAHHAGGGSATSMYLGHSRKTLNTDYRELQFHGIAADEGSGAGEVVASQWLSGRKKGVLANTVVATVDQVLFMALQGKHSMLRHLGLAGKVVVIDEVHAYDAYMSEYMTTVLAWLARYRAPVVLLSATLPTAQKRALVDAYRQEFDAGPLEELSTEYPMITTVGADGVHETEVRHREADLHASIELIEDSPQTLLDALQPIESEGGCVLIICNTVRRAQEAYLRLQELYPEDVELHHAAFLASERARKEERLRDKLGPQAHRGGKRPKRRLVVATQVAEQSLDIDVDLLVTDIAPMDLLIQRIGRLHRHSRPESDRPPSLRAPQVLVRAIESVDPPEFEGGAKAVYDPALLLATLAVLRGDVVEKGFTRPQDIAPLVQTVYGPTPPIPPKWADLWEAASQQSAAQRKGAQTRASTYRFPSPSVAADLDSLFDAQKTDVDTARGEAKGLAQVRDADPSIEVIPILRTENGYMPLLGTSDTELFDDAVPEEALAFALAGASVRLPARFSRYESTFNEVLDVLEPATPPGWQGSYLLKGQLALPLDADRSISLVNRVLVYDDDLGLYDATDSGPPRSTS